MALVVTAGTATTTYPIATLPDSLAVFRFAADSTIDISYAIRPSATAMATGVLRLQQVIGGGEVLVATTPYASTLMASVLEGEGYALDAASGSDSGVSWLISPYADGSYWDELAFQSDAGSGASSPITLTFGAPIAKAVIEIFDPTYAGNTAVAYDSTGEVDSVAFTYSGDPGDNEPAIDSLTGKIDSLVLTPADSDYVAYVVSITLISGVKITVTYGANTPMGADSNPFILPIFTSHTGSGRRAPKPQYDGHDWDTTLAMTIQVDSAGQHIPSLGLTLSLSAADSGGTGSDSVFGHFHSDSSYPKPVGTLSHTSLTTDDSGRATVTYTAGTVSEPVTLVIATAHGDSLQKRWTVGVGGLEELDPSGTYIDTTGAISPHRKSFYAVPAMIPYLVAAADSIHRLFGHDLLLNDMSLPYGGFFDLDTHWGADSIKHLEHRLGRSADADVHGKAYARLYKIWTSDSSAGLFVFPEGSHLHLRYWRP